jgi:hypothetical protein
MNSERIIKDRNSGITVMIVYAWKNAKKDISNDANHHIPRFLWSPEH